MKKKLIAVLLCMVLVIAAVPSVFAANDREVTFTVTQTPVSLTQSASEQTVTLSVDANKTVTVDGIQAMLPYPNADGETGPWTISAIGNKTLTFRGAHYQVKKADDPTTGQITWDSEDPDTGDMPSLETTNLFTVTYKIPAGTPAGEYVVEINDFELTDNGGEIWESTSLRYTVVIEEAPTPVDGVTVDPETATLFPGDTQELVAKYDPEKPSVQTATWTSSDTAVATVNEDGVVTAVAGGTATITHTVTDVLGNTKTATATITVYKTVDKPTAETGLKYTGSEQTGVAAATGYTVEGGKGTNAGEYTATAKLAEGYAWSDKTTVPAEVKWSIAPKTVAAPAPTETEFEYNGKAQTVAEGTSEYTVEGGTQTNAGEYTATATLKDTTNYTWEDGKTDPVSIEWTIAPKEVKLPEAKTGLVYNGSEQTGVEGTDEYTVEGGKETNAGTYTATVALKDKANYVWANNGQSADQGVDWEIEQAELTSDKLELAVGGSKQLPEEEGLSYELLEPAEGEEPVVELDENGKVTGLKEGEATIVVVSNGRGNYKDGDAEITVTVTKPPVTGDKTMLYIISAVAALVVLGAYLIVSKKREQR